MSLVSSFLRHHHSTPPTSAANASPSSSSAQTQLGVRASFSSSPTSTRVDATSPTTTPTPADESLRLERTLHRLERLVARARLATAGMRDASASSQSMRLQRTAAKNSTSAPGPTVRVARFASLSDEVRASEEEAETASLMRAAVELVAEDERNAYAPTRAAGEARGCLFGQFCERDGLGMLVDVASGRAFRSEGRDVDDKVAVLAPPAVATEALGCISYLVRNVVEPMTLCFILSHKKLRGLVADWDVSLYDAVEDWGREATMLPDASASFKSSGGVGERHRIGRRGSGGGGVGERQRVGRRGSSGGGRNPSADISTKFVALLCSLAERLSPDTVQFFLATKTVQVEGNGDDDESRRVNSTTFPLYERALRFCSHRDLAASGDAILRLSAAKVCTDVVKLITARTDDSVVPKSDESVCLSLGRRLDMARCVCRPEHVKALVGPVFERISDLLDALQWTAREVDARNAGNFGGDQDSQHNRKGSISFARPSMARMPSEVCRLRDAAEGILADIEVEVILLDDVLSAGLTFLNEQIVDLFLCIFVHRLLPKLDLLRAYEDPTEVTSPDNGGKVSTLLPVFQSLQKAAKTDPIDPSRWSRYVLDLLFREEEEKHSEFGIKSIEWHHSSSSSSSSPPSASGQGASASTDDPLEVAAAAKAALLVVTAVFCNVLHKPLVHLLFVSLFNADMPSEEPPPLALTINVDVSVSYDDAIASKRRGEIRTDNDGVLCYDFDRHRKRMQSSNSSSSPKRRADDGGKCRGDIYGENCQGRDASDGEKEMEEERGRNVVVLSLAPAFTDVFRGVPPTQGVGGGRSGRAPNRHRRAVAAYLAGKGEDQLRLKPFATLAARAALTAVAGGKGRGRAKMMRTTSSSSRRPGSGNGAGSGGRRRGRKNRKSGRSRRKEEHPPVSPSRRSGGSMVPEEQSEQTKEDQQCAMETTKNLSVSA